MTEYEYADDPSLTPHEKEVSIHFDRKSDEFVINSEVSTVTKWLDNHPEFETWNTRVEDGVMHGICGSLPLGCLKLQGTNRKSQNVSSVLSKLPRTECDDA